MRAILGLMLALLCSTAAAQPLGARSPQLRSAYPEAEAAAAWQGLASGYVRKAIKDGTLNTDRTLNARTDAVMATVAAAVAALDGRFSRASWKAILIEDFGRGAAAFPGETILVDAKFVRALQLNNDELAMILSHEAAHVIAGHSLVKLSFMAELLGKERIPTARTALVEFLVKDSYAAAFQPTARLQEREADSLGAAIFFAAGYDAQSALGLFDKLAELEARSGAQPAGSHDAAAVRRRAISGVLEDLRRHRAPRDPG